MKVLIAEDDAVSRKILHRAVEKLGHECLPASDGLEAWENFQNTSEVDVVISDWMMPGMDGLEFCRRVRGVDRPGYTFFVFLTALGDRGHLLEGMQAGADEYLTKPLDIEQLRARLLVASRVTSLHRHLDVGTEEHGKQSENVTVLRASPSVLRSTIRNTRVRGGNVWDILISENKLNEEQLQKALEVQEKDRRELGEVLLSLGYISEEDLAQAEARRMNLNYVDLTEDDVERGAMSLVGEKVSRKHGVIPLAIKDGNMILAMSDPTDLYALEDLRVIAGYPIVPVLATETRVRQIQNKLFSAGE